MKRKEKSKSEILFFGIKKKKLVHTSKYVLYSFKLLHCFPGGNKKASIGIRKIIKLHFISRGLLRF